MCFAGRRFISAVLPCLNWYQSGEQVPVYDDIHTAVKRGTRAQLPPKLSRDSRWKVKLYTSHVTRGVSDEHPQRLAACNFLSQYYFYSIFLQKSRRFSLQILSKLEASNPEVALDFCVWPLCGRHPACENWLSPRCSPKSCYATWQICARYSWSLALVLIGWNNSETRRLLLKERFAKPELVPPTTDRFLRSHVVRCDYRDKRSASKAQ